MKKKKYIKPQVLKVIEINPKVTLCENSIPHNPDHHRPPDLNDRDWRDDRKHPNPWDDRW